MLRIAPLAALALAIPAAAQEPALALTPVTFTCERAVVLPVTFVNHAGGASVAIATIDGRQIPMALTVSGSGARYRSILPDAPYILHTKGPEALVLYGADADAATLLSECTSDN